MTRLTATEHKQGVILWAYNAGVESFRDGRLPRDMQATWRTRPELVDAWLKGWSSAFKASGRYTTEGGNRDERLRTTD